jgi:hypothetical protein
MKKQNDFMVNAYKRFRRFILLSLFTMLFSSCISYNILPENVSEKSNIVGFYLNDSNDKYNTRIWQVLDYKREIKEDSITVRVEILNEKTLSFTFLKDNEVIGKKLVKGKFKDDNCFYKRRVFYVIPIAPILWGFSNDQTRIYFANNELVIENAFNHGGVFIFMASGDKGNRVYRFKRI